MGFAFTPLLYYPARIAWILEASSLGWARGGPDGRQPARPVPATFNRAPESGKSARHIAPPRALLHRGFPAIREWWLVYPPLWPVAICRTKSGRRVLRGVWLRQAASRAEPSPPRHWGAPQAARPSPAARCFGTFGGARLLPPLPGRLDFQLHLERRHCIGFHIPPGRAQTRQPVVHAPPVLLKRRFGHLHPSGARHGAQPLFEPVAIQRVVREHFAVQPACGFASGLLQRAQDAPRVLALSIGSLPEA